MQNGYDRFLEDGSCCLFPLFREDILVATMDEMMSGLLVIDVKTHSSVLEENRMLENLVNVLEAAKRWKK